MNKITTVIKTITTKLFHNIKGKRLIIKKGNQFELIKGSKIRFGKDCLIREHSYFQLTTKKAKCLIGDGVVIGRYNTLAIKDKIIIGSNTIIGSYVQIIDHDHSTELGLMKYNKPVTKKVIIGRGVWIGAGVKILKGVNIGDGAVIGANAVVTKDIPPNTINVGIPTRTIKERTKEAQEWKKNL